MYLRNRKSEHFKRDKLTYLSTNLNSEPLPITGKPKLRQIKEDLSINNVTHLFLVVFYLTKKYDILFKKVADQGPHILYCCLPRYVLQQLREKCRELQLLCQLRQLSHYGKALANEQFS